VSVLSVGVTGPEGKDDATFDLTDELTVAVTYQVTERMHGLQLVATLARNSVTLLQTFDTDDYSEVPVREPGIYEARLTLPAMVLKAGLYTLDVHIGTAERLIQALESVATFEIDELSVNTHAKGYRRERLGHVIAPGTWDTRRVEELEATPR
jgi:lipopolysaccharide transport system ATP-binding protein